MSHERRPIRRFKIKRVSSRTVAVFEVFGEPGGEFPQTEKERARFRNETLARSWISIFRNYEIVGEQ